MQMSFSRGMQASPVQAPKLAAIPTGGGGGGTGLSMLLQLMRMQNMMAQQEMTQMRLAKMRQQMEEGFTPKEREKTYRQRAMKAYEQELLGNAEFRQIADEALLNPHSPEYRLKAFKKLQQDYINPVSDRYKDAGVSPQDMFNAMFGEHQKRAQLEQKEIAKDGTGAIGRSLVIGARGLWDTLRDIRTLGTNAEEIERESQEFRKNWTQDNKYLQNQALREAEGESWWDRTSGLAGWGSFLAESAPAVAGFLLPGGAAKATLNLARLPAVANGVPWLSRIINTITPNAANASRIGGAALGAGMGDLSYVQQAVSDPDVDTKEALGSVNRLGNAAISAVTGALAPNVAGPLRAAKAVIRPGNVTRAEALTKAAERTARAGYGENILSSAAGFGLLGAAQTLGTNRALQNLGSQRDMTSGLSDAILSGAILGGLFGAGHRFLNAPPPEAKPAATTNPTTPPTPASESTPAPSPAPDSSAAAGTPSHVQETLGRIDSIYTKHFTTPEEQAFLQQYRGLIEQGAGKDPKVLQNEVNQILYDADGNRTPEAEKLFNLEKLLSNPPALNKAIAKQYENLHNAGTELKDLRVKFGEKNYEDRLKYIDWMAQRENLSAADRDMLQKQLQRAAYENASVNFKKLAKAEEQDKQLFRDEILKNPKYKQADIDLYERLVNETTQSTQQNAGAGSEKVAGSDSELNRQQSKNSGTGPEPGAPGSPDQTPASDSAAAGGGTDGTPSSPQGTPEADAGNPQGTRGTDNGSLGPDRPGDRPADAGAGEPDATGSERSGGGTSEPGDSQAKYLDPVMSDDADKISIAMGLTSPEEVLAGRGFTTVDIERVLGSTDPEVYNQLAKQYNTTPQEIKDYADAFAESTLEKRADFSQKTVEELKAEDRAKRLFRSGRDAEAQQVLDDAYNPNKAKEAAETAEAEKKDPEDKDAKPCSNEVFF